MNPIFAGLAGVYGAAADFKNYLYEHGLKVPEDCGRPVISIGNLTVGGTGKTPIVDFCLRLLLQKNHRPGIVCRSYRGSACHPGRVDPSRPEVFGDEASWYALRHPGLPVWSGPSKTLTAKALVKADLGDVVLIDDGFQHRRLHRDVDLLLLDATDGPAAYECVPQGRAREHFAGIRRATAILLTKTNLADPEKVRSLKKKLGSAKPIFEFSSKLSPVELPSRGSLLLVSGIARPESFETLVKGWLPDRQQEVLRFPDHHSYSPQDVATILAVAARQGASACLVTEKDSVKLRPLWTSEIPLIPLSLEVDLEGSVESFYAVLRGAFHQSH